VPVEPALTARSSLAAKPWRIALLVYVVAMTIGTHWPKLRLGTEESPAPDKIIHMLAFGGLVMLLWQSRLIASPWLAWLIVAIWAPIDELTQAYPGSKRTISMQDTAAGEIGALLMLAWIWALSPVGGTLNRLRLRWQAFQLQELFRRRAVWLWMIATLIPGIVIVLTAWLWFVAVFPEVRPWRIALVALPGVMLAGIGMAAILYQLRAVRDQSAEARPCFDCGASCTNVVFDERGCAACPGCGHGIHRGQWPPPLAMTLGQVVRLGWRPALLAFCVFLGVIAAYVALVFLKNAIPAASELNRWYQSLARDLRLVIDLGWMGIAAAVVVRIYRRRAARAFDEQDRYCASCGHDLRATPIDRGVGICGECGTPFIRLEPDSETQKRINAEMCVPGD
jgi:hypothetical protein